MAGHIKIYEEKKNNLPFWACLPLLIALLSCLSAHRGFSPIASSHSVPGTASPIAFPDSRTVHFATDQATLTPEGAATLQRAAEAVKANPSVHLRLEGDTDSTGRSPQ